MQCNLRDGTTMRIMQNSLGLLKNEAEMMQLIESSLDFVQPIPKDPEKGKY